MAENTAASGAIPLKISWGSKKFDLEFDTSQGVDTFKGIIFSLTQVPPEKQKILRRKIVIDSDETLAGLKAKARLKLIGSADSAPVKSSVDVVFAEDLSVADQAKLGDVVPPGLENLGNTCYLNATVQCLNGVQPLSEALQLYGQESLNPSVSKSLGRLFLQMNSTQDSFKPMEFVMLFRQAFPQFAEMDQNRRGFLQQDASEFMTQLFTRIKDDAVGGDIIKNLFEVEFERTETCPETNESTKTDLTDTKLTCFVNKNISHLIFGLSGGLDSEVEKNSEQLGRQAIWKRSDRIKTLPEFLCINVSRFQWKQTSEGGVNCKQLRKVTFPFKLDVSSLCTEDFKARMMKYRQEKLDWEDEMREKKQSEGLGLENEDKAKEKTEEPKQTTEEEVPSQNPPAATQNEQAPDAMDVEPAETEKMEEEKLPNETGEYELCGVVTHKGRSTNSGHYIGYSKSPKSGRWMKYDDDVVTEVKEEDIQNLYGGGDFQMGYICFYKKIPPVEMTPIN